MTRTSSRRTTAASSVSIPCLLQYFLDCRLDRLYVSLLFWSSHIHILIYFLQFTLICHNMHRKMTMRAEAAADRRGRATRPSSSRTTPRRPNLGGAATTTTTIATEAPATAPRDPTTAPSRPCLRVASRQGRRHTAAG